MRKIGLDFLKIFACIGVVLIHTTIWGFTNTVNGIDMIGQFNLYSYLFYLGVYAVPIFFMLNGYFLLQKKQLSYTYMFNKIKHTKISSEEISDGRKYSLLFRYVKVVVSC